MTNIRITVACPEALISDANNLAMVLGQGPDDGQTYGAPGWQDEAGSRYAAASFEVSADWIAAAQGPATRPVWDQQPYTINMTGAGRARASLLLWDGTGAVPQATAGVLLAIPGAPGPVALALMGLTQGPD